MRGDAGWERRQRVPLLHVSMMQTNFSALKFRKQPTDCAGPKSQARCDPAYASSAGLAAPVAFMRRRAGTSGMVAAGPHLEAQPVG